ncbi:MAG: aminopeptidase P family N-terminal domain-containing protein, partial [Rhizobiaceae bacterium]
MFQNFDSVSDPSLAKTRVAALRALFGQLGIDGFLVPRTDEHQGEYVAARAERLRWLTGFSGSAGIALILAEEAHVFVDGRYTLQVREQTDPAIFQWQSLVDLPPAKFLAARNLAGLTIGFDPWLHTIGEVRTLRAAVEEAGGLLKPLPDNPVDAIWTDQPGAPLEAVTIHDERFAGRLARDKLAELADMIGKAKCSHAVLTDPSSLAWAFNIRGSDVPHTPLALGFAILAADGNHLVFMDKRKLPMVTEAYMTQLCTLRPPSALESDLAALAGDGAVFGLDPVLCADRVREIAEAAGGKTIALADP